MSNLPLLSVGVMFVLGVPPLENFSLWAHLLVAVALFMLCLGQNHAWSLQLPANRALKSTNYMHENTGAGHNFCSTNTKCESIPKPPYHSIIVAYEDDQTVIYHSNFLQIHFSVSKIFFVFIFTSNCHDDVMITPPQQAYSWSWRLPLKYVWDRQTAFKVVPPLGAGQNLLPIWTRAMVVTQQDR
jgi:hypothetical protein